MATEAQPKLAKANYFPALDGLRLVASLNIVLLHLNASWCLMTFSTVPIIGKIITGPMFSATLFFVLGGFIYFHLLSNKFSTLYTPRFLWSRLKKLYPLHAFATFLMVYVIWAKDNVKDWYTLIASALSHLSLTWSFTPELFHSLNEPSWALTAFFIAYATMAWVGRFFNRIQSKRIMVTVMACLFTPTLLALFFWTQLDLFPEFKRIFHVSPTLRIFEFYFGMGLARLFQLKKPSIQSPWLRDGSIVLSIIISWFLVSTLKNIVDVPTYLIQKVYSVVFYGWLIWHLARNQGLIGKLFSMPIVQFLGKGSFYPYLLHIPLIGVFILISHALGFSGFFKLWWQPIAYILIIYIVSAFYTKWRKE